MDVGRSLFLTTPEGDAQNGWTVPCLYVVYPNAAGHKRKISDSKKEGLKILTCGLTVTYILESRKKTAIRHAKRTLIVPKRIPIVPESCPNRSQTCPNRHRSQIGQERECRQRVTLHERNIEIKCLPHLTKPPSAVYCVLKAGKGSGSREQKPGRDASGETVEK